MVCQWRLDTIRKEERQRRQAEKGDAGTDDLLESQVLAATRIAAHWKRKVDRRRFIRMREDEFEFLGMAPPRNDTKAHALEEMKKHCERRQKMQVDADDVYEKALKEQLEIVHKKKGADIKADLLEDRRQWILDYRQDPEKLKFPADFDEFYNRFDKEQDDEGDDKGKDKGKDAKKGDKGKDGKKAKDGKKGG